MPIVNIHEAKTHLSRLIDAATKGEVVIIAKAGRPLVRLSALDAPHGEARRPLGFMSGAIVVPEDFDTMGATEIAALFGAEV